MATECFVGLRQSHMSVYTAVDDIAVHPDHVGWRGWIPDKNIPRRKSAVANNVEVVTFDRTNPRQDDGVAHPVLPHHLFHSRQQIGLVLESQHQNTFELAADRIGLGYLVAVRLGVIKWRSALGDLGPGFLSCE